MTLVCFLHAGIPSVTVGSTAALMLIWPLFRMFLAFAYLKSLSGLMVFRRSLYRPSHSIISFA